MEVCGGGEHQHPREMSIRVFAPGIKFNSFKGCVETRSLDALDEGSACQARGRWLG